MSVFKEIFGIKNIVEFYTIMLNFSGKDNL